MLNGGQRLLLFDVDGTLLTSGPMAKRVFSDALTRVFGTAGDVDAYRFEGKLDPIIVTELLVAAGVETAAIEARRDEALDLYLDLLDAALAAERPSLKPGVRELLEALADEPRSVSALLTGNLPRGARIKLTAAGLWHHFAFGAFGNDAPRRVGLGPVALRRAFEATGRSFTGADTVVIGDAPADVECGLALGARVVAVATGRTSREELAAAGAHVVFPDFSELPAVREALLA